MSTPEANPDDPPRGDPGLQSLVAACLSAGEDHGPQGIEELLARHPEQAAAARRRLEALTRLGLVPDEPIPERIGGYRVLGLLGRGGMGTVYEAEQESPRRRVALKVLREDAGSSSRFRQEAELLARLRHPGIAQVYEVGQADLGGLSLPFFAMELVRGTPLDRYAAERGCTLRQKLELLARVCEAVDHAHRQGVIHRDLKPANVLVDERGEPRVLDFGLARAVDPELDLTAPVTRSGQLLGTLAYMSPEQAAGDSRAIDARSDVYSLGVVAYELLAGRRPHDPASSTVLEALRSLRDDDPPLLGRLDRALRGDLETIVAKALEKDPARRYASAFELRADLLHYLAGEPIAAHPPSTAYQVRKLVGRHRLLVAACAVVLLTLVAGLAGTLHGLVRAKQGRAEAERRLAQASAVLDFQRRMLSSADPGALGREARVLDVLTSAALELEDAFDGQPEVEAAVRRVVGETYAGLGLYEQARQHLERALALYRRELGPRDPQALEAQVALGGLFGRAMSRVPEGEQLLREAVEVGTAALGADSEAVLRARLELVTVLSEQARFGEAAALAAQVVRDAEQGGRAKLALEARRSLAWALSRSGETERAVAEARSVLATQVEGHGAEHPTTLRSRETLGVILQNAGRVEESGALIESVWEARRRLLGEDHPDTLRTLANLAPHYLTVGDLERAEELARMAAEACEQELGRGHALTLLSMNNLAVVLQGRKKLDQAVEVMERTLAVSTEAKGPTHADTLKTQASLAKLLQHTPRFEEAEPLLTAALEAARGALGDDSADTLTIGAQLASLYAALGRRDDAARLYAEVVEKGRRAFLADDPQFGMFRAWAGQNLRELGRFEEAESLLVEALDCFERTLGRAHEWTLHAQRCLDGLERDLAPHGRASSEDALPAASTPP